MIQSYGQLPLHYENATNDNSSQTPIVNNDVDCLDYKKFIIRVCVYTVNDFIRTSIDSKATH